MGAKTLVTCCIHFGAFVGAHTVVSIIATRRVEVSAYLLPTHILVGPVVVPLATFTRRVATFSIATFAFSFAVVATFSFSKSLVVVADFAKLATTFDRLSTFPKAFVVATVTSLVVVVTTFERIVTAVVSTVGATIVVARTPLGHVGAIPPLFVESTPYLCLVLLVSRCPRTTLMRVVVLIGTLLIVVVMR